MTELEICNTGVRNRKTHIRNKDATWTLCGVWAYGANILEEGLALNTVECSRCRRSMNFGVGD